MPKTKPYSGTIERQLAIELLNASGQRDPDGRLLGDALVHTAELMADLAEKANKYLSDSEFSEIVAEHLARKINKRGHAEIVVSSEGRVRLDITYEEKPKQRRKSRTRRVPLLAELRAKAEELGADITQFGTKRRAIWEHLQQVEGGDPVEAPTVAKNSRKAPKVEDPGPMSAGPDETRVSPPPSTKPPKKASVNPGARVEPVVVDAGSTPKPDLRKLVADAKEVDIARLIESENPE